MWPGDGTGRFWKRRLAKARRQAIRAELAGRKPRKMSSKEGEVNYRTW